VMETIEILPEIPEEIKPPETVVKPIVNIEIIDDPDVEDDTIKEIETTDITTDIEIVIAPPPKTQAIGETPRFVPYEDAPVIVAGPRPAYPDHLRRMKITGQVVLDIEVFDDGTIGAIEVVKSLMDGPGGFDEAAVNAVKQWKIQPV